jgi:hypothetical protein
MVSKTKYFQLPVPYLYFRPTLVSIRNIFKAMANMVAFDISYCVVFPDHEG